MSNNPYEVIKTLEEESGTNNKIAILQANDNPELRKVLKFAYDPLITFGLKQRDFADPISGTNFDQDWKQVETVLNKLIYRELTGNAAKDAVTRVSCLLNAQQQYVFSCILDKDTHCGINVKLINKAFPGLINNFSVQLANKDVSKIQFPCVVEIKHNGKRNVAVVNGNVVQHFSRNGILQENFSHFDEQLVQLANGETLVFDGEVRGKSSKHTEQYEQVKRYAKKTGGKSSTKAEDLVYVIWDVIQLGEWQRCTCSMDQHARSKRLENMFYEWMNNFQEDDLFLRLSRQKTIVDQKSLEEEFDKQIALGKEGLIVKNPKSKYEYKRSNAWIKMKCEEDVDIPIVDFVERIEKGNQHTGILAAVVCDYNGTKVHCPCGKGITMEEGKELWEKRKKLVGKIAKVVYMNETTNVKGNKSLYLPKFIEVRDDK